jgi:hypothetical protein
LGLFVKSPFSQVFIKDLKGRTLSTTKEYSADSCNAKVAIDWSDMRHYLIKNIFLANAFFILFFQLTNNAF